MACSQKNNALVYYRQKALKAYHEERQKKHELSEYAREKFREGIRQKYGIERKSERSFDLSDAKTIQVSFFFCISILLLFSDVMFYKI